MNLPFYAELSALALPERRLLFYPSCGTDLRFCFRRDCDVVVLADNCAGSPRFWRQVQQRLPGLTLLSSSEAGYVFRYGGKWGFLYSRDNNDVLRYLHACHHRIATFVGITDGCQEGGNYECVNESAFMQRVLALMSPTGMSYLTDHSPFLFRRAHDTDCGMFMPNMSLSPDSILSGNVVQFQDPCHDIQPRQWGLVCEFHISNLTQA